MEKTINITEEGEIIPSKYYFIEVDKIKKELKDNSYIKQVFELLVNLKGIKEFHISPTSPAICSLLEKMPGVEKDFKFYYKAKKIPR